ncbi:phosphopantetheine-binding protein [Streptomyces sp. NBC_00893]|uniref:phosphopantetheine-binding protein n=1 Tax=Streptomyces sp. NBC_00893 TaxID=2975862 RepID=UPI0022557621|nr:phosphopantetheine-binding protein [Streptomyces sp. NBC_00893]MCX4845661.1 phosphopantetheine-binding protein [Streptomyces sp. NBC_00893]
MQDKHIPVGGNVVDRATAVVTEEWCRALDLTEPSSEDDFFQAGGNSLLIATMIDRVEQRLGIEFPVEVAFIDGTLGAMAEACAERLATAEGTTA